MASLPPRPGKVRLRLATEQPAGFHPARSGYLARPPVLPGLPGDPARPGPAPTRPSGVPAAACYPPGVRFQARRRPRAPGRRAHLSSPTGGGAWSGAARPFELAGVGAAESRPGRARDPARSGRRVRAAVGGTGRSAGPPSAGSPGRKGHCPEPPLLPPSCGARWRSAPPAGDGRVPQERSHAQPPRGVARSPRPPSGSASTSRGRLDLARATFTWGGGAWKGRRCGCGLVPIKSPSAAACQLGGCAQIPAHLNSRLPHP